MLGHIEQWFYQGLGGIHLNLSKRPGHQLCIRPAIVGNLRWVHVTEDSVLGRIIVRWRHVGDRLTLHVVIPPNVKCRVYIPTRDAASVRVNGRTLAAAGLRTVHDQNKHQGCVICAAPSGDYHFTSLVNP